jgi:hypothetical protein
MFIYVDKVIIINLILQNKQKAVPLDAVEKGAWLHHFTAEDLQEYGK